MKENIVEFHNVSVDYPLKKYTLRAVTNVTLPVKRGKITALVGESGSGKTTLSSSVIQCISEPGVVAEGEIVFFDDRDGSKDIVVNKLKEKQLKPFRWQRVSMVFQAAQSALNPVLTIEEQFLETLEAHGNKQDKNAQIEHCKKLLDYVKLDADRVLASYPHELSGGMKQRVMIAFSLILNPDLIILDEPTTALDVITQSYIFKLLKQINREMNISMILMTHDISVVAKFADYVGVMYGGRLMEYGTVQDIFHKHRHPYTEGLINATPSIIGDIDKLNPIEGHPPDLTDLPKGCVFSPRCPYIKDICLTAEPPTITLSDGSCGMCYFFNEEGSK